MSAVGGAGPCAGFGRHRKWRRDPDCRRLRGAFWSSTERRWASRLPTAPSIAPATYVSGLNPQQTFLELIDENLLPQSWREKARQFKYNLIAPLFALRESARPAALQGRGEQSADLEKAFMVILGSRGYRAVSRNRASSRSGHDPAYRDVGHHSHSFRSPLRRRPGKSHGIHVGKTSVSAAGRPLNWDTKKRSHGQAMLDLWAEYAPNLKDSVLDWFTRSALDTERTFPNMRKATYWWAHSQMARLVTIGPFRRGPLPRTYSKTCTCAAPVATPAEISPDWLDTTAPRCF